MNILLINAYSAENRGDAGIVVSMIHKIRELYPESNITVMSSYYKENKDFYSEYGVKSVNNVWALNPDESLTKKYLKGLSSLFKVLINKNNEEFNNYAVCDLVISVGGGYLYSSKKGPLGVGFMNALFHIWLALKLNKKTICFPQSVGPLNYKLDRLLSKKILNKVDMFFSREATTTKLLKELKIQNVTEVSDIAFILPDRTSNFEVDKNYYNIGITVMDWRFSRPGSSETDVKRYIDKLVWVLSEFKKLRPKSRVYIFPQVTVGKGDSDYQQSKNLFDNLPFTEKKLISVAEFANNPEELVNMYSKMSVFLGSRMHSTIFSLTGKVPTFALSYQPKTKGTFKRLGLEKFVYDINDFNKEELLKELIKVSTGEESYPLDSIGIIQKDINVKINESFKQII